MLIINTIVLVSSIIITILLFRFYKSLLKIEDKRPVCNFKISKPKFTIRHNRQCAEFNLSVPDKHTFFIDFPVLFRFYSDSRFRSKIRISYRSTKKGKREEIVHKTIIFENKTIEKLHYINDVIIGKIYIEIEVDTDYGSPYIEFMILENKICKLEKEYKVEIKFP